MYIIIMSSQIVSFIEFAITQKTGVSHLETLDNSTSYKLSQLTLMRFVGKLTDQASASYIYKALSRVLSYVFEKSTS